MTSSVELPSELTRHAGADANCPDVFRVPTDNFAQRACQANDVRTHPPSSFPILNDTFRPASKSPFARYLSWTLDVHDYLFRTLPTVTHSFTTEFTFCSAVRPTLPLNCHEHSSAPSILPPLDRSCDPASISLAICTARHSRVGCPSKFPTRLCISDLDGPISCSGCSLVYCRQLSSRLID